MKRWREAEAGQAQVREPSDQPGDGGLDRHHPIDRLGWRAKGDDRNWHQAEPVGQIVGGFHLGISPSGLQRDRRVAHPL